jgi:hypothetical protein
LALAILSGCLALAVAIGWQRGWWPRETRLLYTGLAVTAILVVANLASWRLIGWA